MPDKLHHDDSLVSRMIAKYITRKQGIFCLSPKGIDNCIGPIPSDFSNTDIIFQARSQEANCCVCKTP